MASPTFVSASPRSPSSPPWVLGSRKRRSPASEDEDMEDGQRTKRQHIVYASESGPAHHQALTTRSWSLGSIDAPEDASMHETTDDYDIRTLRLSSPVIQFSNALLRTQRSRSEAGLPVAPHTAGPRMDTNDMEMDSPPQQGSPRLARSRSFASLADASSSTSPPMLPARVPSPGAAMLGLRTSSSGHDFAPVRPSPLSRSSVPPLTAQTALSTDKAAFDRLDSPGSVGSASTYHLPASAAEPGPSMQFEARRRSMSSSSSSAGSSSHSGQSGMVVDAPGTEGHSEVPRRRARQLHRSPGLGPVTPSGGKQMLRYTLGYREDCELCRKKTPGHFTHILPANPDG